MSFIPTADKLLPELTPEQEIVLLARTLWTEGYNDHLAGHITYNLGDGTLLCNPWLMTWDEIRPATSSASTSTATSSRATGRCRSASRCISSCTRRATT